MDILKKIDNIEKLFLNESGVRDIKKLTKKFKEAEIYFHIDLDGVTSAIGFKHYIESYGVKVADVFPIQYGGMEYAIDKGKKGTMKILVDFAHGKPMFDIHVDHHDSQVGVETKSTSFKHAPSGAGVISGEISPKDIFPQRDLDIINTVDSADYARLNLTPDDIIAASFGLNKAIDVKRNHQMMGLVVNKLLLSYKNKPNFLKRVVMKAKPSLISMYNVITKLAKADGYKTNYEIDAGSVQYQEQQKKNMKDGKLSDIKTLKSGQSLNINGIIVQYGGGFMGKQLSFDRYTPFKIYPDAKFFSILWPMGILQVSYNPFITAKVKIHLGELVKKEVFPKFKSRLQNIEVTLDTLKYKFEADIIKKKIKNAVGFTYKDLAALFDKKLKNFPQEDGSYKNMIMDITNKPYNKLSKKQKDILKKVSISGWDVIMSASGGHFGITNIANLNIIPDGLKIGREMQYEIVKALSKKLDKM